MQLSYILIKLRYESNIYVNPNHQRHNQQQRLLNQQQQQQQQQQYSTTSAFQQMLPYQLVPQVEASLLPQLQQQHLQQQQYSNKPPHFVSDTADSRRPLVEHVHNRHLGQMHEQLPGQLQPASLEDGNQYTDTSLQYADDDSDDGAGEARPPPTQVWGGDDEIVGGNGEVNDAS